ncbi:hypothetical protein [Acutalibacter intestini]|uniref:hypothetical protein n=1 Tax=Acutalibacter intestini TaxID=3093659 RepID=UPI00345F1F32
MAAVLQYCDTIRALYSVPGIYIEKIKRINNLAQRYDPGTVYEEVFISNYDPLHC